MSFPEITNTFTILSNEPTLEDVKGHFPLIERFAVLMYSRVSNALTADEARRELFCQGKSIETIPPTSAALYKHVLRAAYIAGYYWGQSLLRLQNLPSPEEWGWKLVNDRYIPAWTDLPEATVTLRDLIKCFQR